MDFETYLRFLLALLAVLALIGVLAWLARRFGLAGALVERAGVRVRRLGIVEVLPVDARRRLVLVRRDGVEHLILTGATHDLVIETRISAPAPSSLVPPIPGSANR
ncbi:MAG: flagellar biosynthetic protein FliO [Alphaproteobacteria bacterium]